MAPRLSLDSKLSCHEGCRWLTFSYNLEHASKICRQAYPPGRHFSVPAVPDVDEVNRRGDYALEADRLAYIDGDRDPWRYCVSAARCCSSTIEMLIEQTPQSDIAPARNSTVNKPLYIIFGESILFTKVHMDCQLIA